MYRGLHGTDAGMHCLWEPTAFETVVDYDSWAEQLLNDREIERHISEGHFVPLNIGDDGGMEIEVRLGTSEQSATLNEREAKHLIVKSEPYFLRTEGKACISGIEHVARLPARSVGVMEVPPGDYEVTIHLIAWDEEPGMQTDDGPAEGALPDYVVLINPLASGTSCRMALRTFDAS
jgi:hypothetical protein